MNRPPHFRAPASGAGEDRKPDALDWIAATGRRDRLLAALEESTRQRRGKRRLVVVAGAVGLLMAGGFASRVFRGGPASTVTLAQTASVETRALADGSRIELAPGAVVSAEFEPGIRKVRLERGRGYFSVAKDPARPFVVLTHGVAVRAVGTAFAVEAGAAVEVIVTEGTVAVETGSSVESIRPSAQPWATLTAGQRISVSAEVVATARVEQLSPSELHHRLEWRAPLLELNRTPLAALLPEFNRHAAVPFALEDLSLGRFELGGVIRAGNSAALLELLETQFGIVGQKSGEVILLRRR